MSIHAALRGSSPIPWPAFSRPIPLSTRSQQRTEMNWYSIDRLQRDSTSPVDLAPAGKFKGRAGCSRTGKQKSVWVHRGISDSIPNDQFRPAWSSTVRHVRATISRDASSSSDSLAIENKIARGVQTCLVNASRVEVRHRFLGHSAAVAACRINACDTSVIKPTRHSDNTLLGGLRERDY